MRKPLYRYTFQEAKRLGELDECRASYKANIECRDGIDEMIRERFDGMYLSGDCAADLCREYGIDRVGWVLANTVQHADWDGRYRPQNKEWAAQTYIPHDANNDRTVDYVCRSHPELLNGLVNQYRKHLQDLGIHGNEAVIHDDEAQDYTGKLLIIKPEVLKDEYKTGDYQYFFAESGFGCDPKRSGQKVFGQFLLDGEKTHFDRSEFLGVADESQLPDWATKKLQELIIICGQNEEGGMQLE